MTDAGGESSLRLVSAVLPVRNEAHSIAASLRSLLTQQGLSVAEVIVADGMSDDGTRPIVEGIAEEDPRVRLIDNPAKITPAGLNAAIQETKGDVIVRCDGHSVLPAGYVARAVELMEDTGADVIGGLQAAEGTGLVQRAIAIAMSTPLGVGDARFHRGGPAGPTDTVYLGVFRRTSLERVGLFDESLVRNQDYELNYRIRQTGGTVYFHSDLRVAYEPRSSLGALWRQYHQYGAWKRAVLRRDPDALRWRQAVPPAFVLGLVASVIVAFTPLRRIGLIVPAAYLLAVIGTVAKEAGNRRDAAVLLLPLVLPVMHVAWGLGFLLGLVRAGEPRIPQLRKG